MLQLLDFPVVVLTLLKYSENETFRAEYKEYVDEYQETRRSLRQTKELLLRQLLDLRKREQEMIGRGFELLYLQGNPIAQGSPSIPFDLQVNSSNSPNRIAHNLDSGIFSSPEGKEILKQLYKK
jgi:hypothetical protein